MLAGTGNTRMTSRQKLTKLTPAQFFELSTDVYDELVRRQSSTGSIKDDGTYNALIRPSVSLSLVHIGKD